MIVVGHKAVSAYPNRKQIDRLMHNINKAVIIDLWLGKPHPRVGHGSSRNTRRWGIVCQADETWDTGIEADTMRQGQT
jgi:hypothetical protein